jgi:hypothetical protein
MNLHQSVRAISPDESQASKEAWMYERAEDAAAAGLPLDLALQCVRHGYDSVEADREHRENP